MAGMLWGAFKERMGAAQGINMKFDLNSLIDKVPDLEELSAPFSQEEEVLKNFPTDRAPGPDGFKGLFVKNVGPFLNMTSLIR